MTHEHTVNFKTAFTIEPLADSEIKISGELPYAELESERTAAIVALSRNLTIPGFRPGHIPQAVVEKHLGGMTIMAEMAERAIAHAYPHILEEHAIQAISSPRIEITKIAPGNPLGFSATVAVVPTFSLPDYKALAVTVNKNRPSDQVTDAEVEDKVKDILRQKAAYERLQAKAAARDAKKDEPEATEPELIIPELTDDIAASLGQPDQFSGADDFRTKLREHLEIEKKTENAARHRAAITDSIIAATSITLPKILIDSEINQMLAQMEDDLDRASLQIDDYLAHIKKTKADLIEEWKPAAEKRAQLQLILNEIAKTEAIALDETVIEERTSKLLERFKDADPLRVRIYVASVLTNEAVMEKLENF